MELNRYNSSEEEILTGISFNELSKQETEDIMLVVNDSYKKKYYINLSEERKTMWVSVVAVRALPYNYGYVPETVNTDGLKIEVLKFNGYFLTRIKLEERTDEMYEQAVLTVPEMLKEVPYEKRKYQLCLKAVERYGLALMYVPAKYRNRKITNIAIHNVEEDNDAYDWLFAYIDFPDLILEYIKIIEGYGQTFEVADMRDIMHREVIDTDLAEFLVKKDPEFISCLPENVLNRNICTIAVTGNIYMFEHIPGIYHDMELWNEIFVDEANVINIFSLIKNFNDIDDITIDYAMSVDPLLVEHLPEDKLPRTRCKEVIDYALKETSKQRGWHRIINHIPYEDMRTDAFIKFIKIYPAYYVLESLEVYLQNVEIAKIAVKADPNCYMLLHDDNITPEIIHITLSGWNKKMSQRQLALPMKKLPERVLELVKKCYPRDYDLLIEMLGL